MTPSHWRWIAVALLWVTAALNYLDRQMIFSVLPLVQHEFAVSSAQLGFLGTAFLWIYGLLSPFGGYLADRVSRKKVILFSLLVWSAVTWMTGHVSSFSQLAMARALMGVSEAFYLPAALALLADYHPESTRALAVGIHQSGLYAGIVLGGWGGGWLGEHYGWRRGFVLLGGIGIAYAAVLALALRSPARSGAMSGFGGATRELFQSPGFRLVLAANGLASMAYWCVYTWLPFYLHERFGMGLAGAGFSATFYIQAASLIGILLGGWLADRNPRFRVRAQLIGLAVAGPALFVAGTTSTTVLLVASLVAFGLGRGVFDCNLMPVVCQIVSTRLRATAYGFLNLFSCVAGGAMATAGGAIRDAMGLGAALQLSAILLVAGAALLLVLSRRQMVATP